MHFLRGLICKGYRIRSGCGPMRKLKAMKNHFKNNGRFAKRDAWLKDVEIVPYDGPDFNRQYIEALERVEKIKNLDWSAEKNEDRQPA